MLITEIILLASLSIPVLSVLFLYVRIYLVYRLLNDRIGNISYVWFSYEFQLPHQFARLYPGYVDFSTLPEDLRAQVSAARRDLNRVRAVLACWIIFVLVMLFSFRR
jgi:hypothetical protein